MRFEPREALERAHEAFFYVGLGEARYRNVETYSTGMKQRIKLAQALVHDPALVVRVIREVVEEVRRRHQADLAAGRGDVALPGALPVKYPGAAREWAWQWVFPARELSIDQLESVRYALDRALPWPERYEIPDAVALGG